MPFQEKKNGEHHNNNLNVIISILLRCSTFAFRSTTAIEIKRRDHFRCVECHSRKRLVASHNNHNHEDREDYDNPDNGVTRCVFCEVVYHLKYWNNPEDIGLTFNRNLNGLVKEWVLLRTCEQNELANRFPNSVDRIRRQCYHR